MIHGSILQDDYVVVEADSLQGLQRETAAALREAYGYRLEVIGGAGCREVKAGLSGTPALVFWQSLRRNGQEHACAKAEKLI